MEIIKLNKKHAKQLAQIDYESEHQNSSKMFNKKQMLMEIIKRFKQDYEIFFGYKEDNKLNGYVTLKPFFPGYKHCEVYWLAVRKSSQGKGIGTKLMKFIEDYAKRKGFRKVCVYTNKTMGKTRKFYEKSGYKLINEFPRYYSYKKNNTAVLYVKEILK